MKKINDAAIRLLAKQWDKEKCRPLQAAKQISPKSVFGVCLWMGVCAMAYLRG